MSAPWITYRPELKVLDCTIRDGGLCNDHGFEDGFVKAVYEACVAAGIDYMELGYKSSKRIFAQDKFGVWKFCDEADLRRIVGDNPTPLKLAVMIDAGKCDWKTDVLPKKDSVLDLIRVAFYANQVSEAVDMINDAFQKGYEVSANLMAVSTVKEQEIDQVLEEIAKTPASCVCVVDSFGSMYAEQIEILVKKYLRYGADTKKEVGIHAHNNQQLAFANSIEAIIHGANRVDASMAGLGRGAGNCPMELPDRFPAESQVQAAADLRGPAGSSLAAEPQARMGALRAVHDHRPAQRASPQRDGRPGQRHGPRPVRGVLRQDVQRSGYVDQLWTQGAVCPWLP